VTVVVESDPKTIPSAVDKAIATVMDFATFRQLAPRNDWGETITETWRQQGPAKKVQQMSTGGTIFRLAVIALTALGEPC
jgi:hypothetical protein